MSKVISEAALLFARGVNAQLAPLLFTEASEGVVSREQGSFLACVSPNQRIVLPLQTFDSMITSCTQQYQASK